MEFEKSTCSTLSIARHKEWLETNGLGGFASSTIIGMNTRRYHGLLVAATQPPTGRVVLLSKLEDTLVVGGRPYDLSTNQYPGAIHPSGYRRQTAFRLNPLTTFIYSVEDLVIEKTIFMVHGENSTAISYQLLSGPRDDVRLEIKPLIAFRDYHSLTHANADVNQRVHSGPGWLAVTPYEGLPTLYLSHSFGEVLLGGNWFMNFEYDEERDRGLDWREDLFNPFGLRIDIGRGPVRLIASTVPKDAGQLEDLKSAEIQRRDNLVKGWEKSDGFVQQLLRAADQFIVRRGENLSTVIADYHWFTDWGRDTMIALPGLALIPRRYDEARKILLAFAHHCDQGMLPNRFPDAGEAPEYNTVDATLWFFQAIHAYVKHTEDYEFVRGHLYSMLSDILAWHVRGTRYSIKVDEDGLLNAGEPGVQLTWMDVKVGQVVITPRIGKPVEVQALWFNALRVMEHLAHLFGDRDNEKLYGRMAARASLSFNQKFWNAADNCLFDCIDGDMRDASMRPNQIFAVSLPFSMLSPARMRQVVEAVTRELFTPFGLRSLSPKDPRYQGFYRGDQRHRDGAYHEGTVWAWLMGPYVTARVRAGAGSKRARQAAGVLLTGLREHLNDAGIGTISEIFDADEPHTSRGCIAQAWSVAELLRVIVEDLSEFGEAQKPLKPRRARRRV